MTGAMEAALVAVRFVQFTAAFVLLGSPAFALALAAGFSARSAVRQEFDRWLRRSLLAAAGAALVTAALWLDLEAVIMGNGWGQAVDTGTIAIVLFGTLFGRAWCWHMGIGIVLLGSIVLLPARSSTTILLALLAAVFVAGLAWAGHAVMHPGASHLIVQVTHLLAGAIWLGSLPALLHVATKARFNRSEDWEDALRHVLPIYSRAGYVAVGLVLLTGILNCWYLVGSIGRLATTPYGHVLVAKIALVLIMVGIAAINRFVLLPEIETRGRGDEHRLAVRRLRCSVAVELGMSALVLAAVSLLGILPPALAP
ncbi:MAG TPA: copper homeostasis membrane protein CopD [Stellaceae bacterium]|nr:copper homeostasis membrane protein CopD [Stellaceae bacterium]